MKSTESNLYQEEAQSKLLDRGRAVLDVEVAPICEKSVEMGDLDDSVATDRPRLRRGELPSTRTPTKHLPIHELFPLRGALLCTSPSPTMASAVPSTLPLRGGTKQRKLASPDQAKQRKNRNTRNPTRGAQDRSTPALVRLTAWPPRARGGDRGDVRPEKRNPARRPALPTECRVARALDGQTGMGPED